MNALTLVFPIVTLLAIVCFFLYYRRVMRPRPGTTDWIRESLHPAFSFPGGRHRVTARDALPLFLITVLYAATAFYQLGNTRSPISFASFQTFGETAEFTFRTPFTLTSAQYFSGLGTGEFQLEVRTEDGAWQALEPLEQTYVEVFKWNDYTTETPLAVTAVRLTSSGFMELGEIALYDQDGNQMDAGNLAFTDARAAALFDEQDTVPEARSYMHSTYFDEIYHARTAYEHIRGIYPYEITHPPLGKLILGLGIRLFGMTPFGWRFMGTLFGVLMLPILYCFLKNLFGKTAVSVCGTLLFAFDFMHLTQTRIATIDTYAVFFTLLMYWFFYRYLSLPDDATVLQSLPSLFLAGLFFGLGAASKWTVLYGGAGLAVLWLIHAVRRGRIFVGRGEGARFGGWLAGTVLLSIVCFVVIPAAIYGASYLPYAQAKGGPLSFKLIWDNQVYMFNYHRGVTQSHPYASKWWMWIFDIRPILYYLETGMGGGLKSAFGAFGNPVVYWGGLLSLAALVWRFVRVRSGAALFILVGYLAQLVPWIPISRPTFAYHYFPATVFLVLAVSYVMNDLLDRRQGSYRAAVYGFTAGCGVLYAAFYPVLVGVAVPVWYTTNFLQWFPSWPF